MKKFLILIGIFVVLSLSFSPFKSTANKETEDNEPNIHNEWKLKYVENFSENIPDFNEAPWTIDPHGDESPWNVDHLDDDGRYFQVKGGEDFNRHLESFNLMRKRIAFGKDDWLTAELASRDNDKNGKPETPPELQVVNMENGGKSLLLNEESYNSGVVIRSTKALPSQYRIEYELRTLDFGGKRNGSSYYDNKYNGYDLEGCKSNFPWKNGGSYAGESSECNRNFGKVREENGFYYLAIMDYENPAPHNNIFIHNHRKVVMDGYNTEEVPWGRSKQVCNPKTGEYYPYYSDDSNHTAVYAIFQNGSEWFNKNILYPGLAVQSECGDEKPKDVIGVAELQPELMPNETYKFAIERNEQGYTLEMSGDFLHVGQRTFRYQQDFVDYEKNVAIWHYNNKSEEYNGEFNSTLEVNGPNGSYSVEQWPSQSAYPDYFLIGDPHINYYEGSATIDNIRLYEPKKK
jgi:hypothetical protein